MDMDTHAGMNRQCDGVTNVFRAHAGMPTADRAMTRARALRHLRQSKGRQTVHEFTEMGGRRVVRYAQVRVMSAPASVPQHTRSVAAQDWQVGDVHGVLEIIRPLDKDEARVSEALRVALLLSAVVSGLLLAGSMLVVWAGRRRTQVGS